MEFQSEGNGAVLLLIDKSQRREFDQVGPAVLNAFKHLGIPYCVRDLENGLPSTKELLSFSCIILGQDHLGDKLGSTGAASLRDAVKEGSGLVCLDGQLGSYSGPFFDIFGVTPGLKPFLCSTIKAGRLDHFITGTREPDDEVTPDRPVEVWPVESSKGAPEQTILLKTANNSPAVIATPFGRGRSVLFAFSLQMWTNEFLGHAGGLDDVFWKSIVWAARKPFALYAMPPFTTALVDDCSGSYNHFRYVDTMSQYGWIPHIEVYLEDIDRVMHHEDYADSKKIKSLYDEKLAEFGVHGLTYDHLMWFDHKNRKSLSDDELKKNFEIYDACLEKWQITPSRIENMHFGEIGVNALPFLKQRGIEYLSMVLPFDTAFLDVPEKKPPLTLPGPYHLRGYYMAHLPEDPHFFILRSFLEPKDFNTNAPAPHVDFLWGNTIFWDESPRTNIEQAARIAVLQVRRGLDARFYGTTVAHEQRVAVIPMDEWAAIYARIDNGLKKYNLIHRSWEYIADYARSRYHTRISSVSVNRDNGSLHCSLTGKASVATALEVYINEGGTVRCRSCEVPSFSGMVTVTV
ncbi:MAG: hypothetical protein WC975_06825 [Phycisphaerae bacterium]